MCDSARWRPPLPTSPPSQWYVHIILTAPPLLTTLQPRGYVDLVSLTIGGNGTTTSEVARSCSAVFGFWKIISAKSYIDDQLRPASAIQQQCINGTSYGGDGSTPSNAAVSCQTALDHFGVSNTTVYINFNPTAKSQSPVLVYCAAGASLGGDGTMPRSAALSCATAMQHFAVVDSKTYVFVNGSSSGTVQVHCVNGSSMGGDGSSVQASAVSCAALKDYWNLSNGHFFVQGSLTYVPFFISFLDHRLQTVLPLLLRRCAPCELLCDLRPLHPCHQPHRLSGLV